MRLDYVHDLQKCFRAIVMAMSFPGSVVDLQPYSDRIDIKTHINPASILLALVLLDAEVSFSILPNADRGAARLISQMTYARQVDLPSAGYVIVTADGAAAVDSLKRARTGTLLDPHLGATIIWEVSEVSEAGNIELHGPGIPGTRTAGIVTGISNPEEWVSIRAERNREYPLGIDMLLVDTAQRLMALPRTTQILISGT